MGAGGNIWARRDRSAAANRLRVEHLGTLGNIWAHWAHFGTSGATNSLCVEHLGTFGHIWAHLVTTGDPVAVTASLIARVRRIRSHSGIFGQATYMSVILIRRSPRSYLLCSRFSPLPHITN